jgi:hypothetical protein
MVKEQDLHQLEEDMLSALSVSRLMTHTRMALSASLESEVREDGFESWS